MQLRKALLPASCPSISANPTAQIYVKIFTCDFYENCSMWLKSGKISGTLHDDLTVFIMRSSPLNRHKHKDVSLMVSGCWEGQRGIRESTTILDLIPDFRLPPPYKCDLCSFGRLSRRTSQKSEGLY